MGEKNFNEKLKKMSTGRGYSHAYVRKTVSDFMSVGFMDLLEAGDEDTSYYRSPEAMAHVREMTGAGINDRTYGEIIYKAWNKVRESRELKNSLAVTMGFMCISPKAADFINLPVIDFLEAAGADSVYRKWFYTDAAEWAKDKSGRVPTIGNVLKGYLEKLFDDSEYNGYYLCRNNMYIVDFRLLRGKFRPFMKDEPIVRKEANETLSASWIWILMAEIPLIMENKIDGNEAILCDTIRK